MPTNPAAPETIIKKGILILNNDLPLDVSSYWLTAEDLRNRLIHSGVRKSLSLEMVHDSLRRYNSNEAHLKTRLYNKTRFYRSAIANAGDSNILPVGQRVIDKTGRWKRVNYLPAENYFLAEANNKHLTAVNNALRELEVAEDQETDKHTSELLSS